MNDMDKELLEADGWTVECESPFEISNPDGSRATGRGAQYVLEFLREQQMVERKCCECGKPATNTEGTFCQEHEHMVF